MFPLLKHNRNAELEAGIDGVKWNAEGVNGGSAEGVNGGSAGRYTLIFPECVFQAEN